MIKNKTTLIIDGNWLMMSRFGAMQDQFSSEYNENALQAASDELVDLLAQSVNKIINFFGNNVDNIIMVQDGGSWRKHIRKPKLYKEDYKGNRVKDEGTSWDYVWKSLSRFCENFKEVGISCFREDDCEGDDWCWYWSRTLNKNGINAIVWTSDRDLQQLVSYNRNKTWTVWYNDKKGLVCHRDLQKKEDLLEDMLSLDIGNPAFDSLKSDLDSMFIDVNFINPLDVALEKVICGDSGDNIKSIMRVKKNDRIARISEKEWESVKESYGEYHDLESFKHDAKSIINDLKNLKRFFENKDSMKDLYQMFLFNMRLVCLDTKYIPKKIRDAMNSHKKEYAQADMESILNNYKVLAPDGEVEVEDLFDIF